jgi:hypothetical protein
MNARNKLVVAAMFVSLGLVSAAPAGATGQYTDPSGDSGSAPDITGVTVSSDKSSGQVIFQINGKNLSSSDDFPTFLDIDSDANPLTGDVVDGGADYSFEVGGTGYGFWHWNGSDWVQTAYSTVRIFTRSAGLMISVNRSEIGNPTDFNFSATSVDLPNKKFDSAPDDGMFNYSLDDGGPSILSVVLQTTPAGGPKAGKPFVVTPTALNLPPNGALGLTTPQPESYTCTATLKGHAVASTGAGGCTFKIAKKKTRGKTLKVVLTVNYQGIAKPFTFTFKVT